MAVYLSGEDNNVSRDNLQRAIDEMVNRAKLTRVKEAALADVILTEYLFVPNPDTAELVRFMNGPDGPTLRRLLWFFNDVEDEEARPFGHRYCHPRELKEFWESLTQSEKNYYHKLVATRYI